MKAKFMLLALLISAGIANAQGGGQRRSPEERAKMAMDKIADFKLDADKSVQADSAITQFYRAQQKAFQEMRESGSIDRDKMREKAQELRNERDEKLKKVFTDDQFKKWKDEIEPSLSPRPRQ